MVAAKLGKWLPDLRYYLLNHFHFVLQRNGQSGYVDSTTEWRQASQNSQEEEAQVNMLLYSMGDKADDILTSFGLSEEQARCYATVKEQFDKHFIPRRNIIFERARFNSRKQEEDETVDAFVTALHGLAEHCNYGNLHNEMIRDRGGRGYQRCTAVGTSTAGREALSI